jgi:hypothetical protein
MGGMTTKPQTDPTPQPRFISLRWRFIFPLFLVMLLVAMLGAYAVAINLGGGLEVSQRNILLQSSRAVAERAAGLYERQRQEAQRIAFTVGVAESIRDRQSASLHSILEGLARGAADSVIVIDTAGLEVLGCSAWRTGDYAVNIGGDLSDQPIIRGVLDEGYVGATGLVRTPEGIMLFTAVPASLGDELVGVVLVGHSLESALAELKGSAMGEVALYGADGALLQTTFPSLDDFPSRTLARELFSQTLTAVQQVPIETVTIGGVPYQSAYFPFHFGPTALGVIGTLLPDNVPFATEVGRQLTALTAAALAGAAVIMAFVASIASPGESRRSRVWRRRWRSDRRRCAPGCKPATK